MLAGEKSGNMEKVLGRYIAFQRLALTFKKKLAVSLVYPALLVSVVSCMLVFLVTYVVPQFAKLYENLGAQLPTITLIMLTFGNQRAKVCAVRDCRVCRVSSDCSLAMEELLTAVRIRIDRCDPSAAVAGRNLVEISGR